MNESEYQQQKNAIIVADRIWLAQSQMVDAKQFLMERGYEFDSNEVFQLSVIISRLTNLAVQIAQPELCNETEETEAEHRLDDSMRREAGSN